jgi:molybdopterin-guanine dinucleotide biosynthesis protein
MNKKQLMELGLTEELADQIVVLHGKDIESHKTKLATAQTELDGVKAQLTEAGATIEGFKKLDVEGIKVAANEWKAKAEQVQADAAKQIASLKFDHALDGALTGAKAHNVKAVKALLDIEQLRKAFNEADGSIPGLDDQLKKVKESDGYQFESDTPTPKVVLGGQNKSVISDAVVDAARKAAGLPPIK